MVQSRLEYYNLNIKHCERVMNGNVYYSLYSILNMLLTKKLYSGINADELEYILEDIRNNMKLGDINNRIYYIGICGSVSRFDIYTGEYKGMINMSDILMDTYILYMITDYIKINDIIAYDDINLLKEAIIMNTCLSRDSLESFGSTYKINSEKNNRARSNINFRINKSMVDNHLARYLSGRVLANAMNVISTNILGGTENEVKRILNIDQNDDLYNHLNKLILDNLANDYYILYEALKYKTTINSIKREVIAMRKTKRIIDVGEYLEANSSSTIDNNADSIVYINRLRSSNTRL